MRGTDEYNVSARFKTTVEKEGSNRDGMPWYFQYIDFSQESWQQTRVSVVDQVAVRVERIKVIMTDLAPEETDRSRFQR